MAIGLGALPHLFARKPTRRWLGLSNAAAAGLMMAASLGLAYEGALRGPVGVLVGAGLGFVFIILVRRLVSVEEHPAVFAGLSGLDACKGLLIVGIMTAHSFTEGVGLGVSFGSGTDLGLFITLAIAVHNIPEGLAISLVLVPRGGGRRPGGFLERLLQPAAAPHGGAGLRLRRSLWPPATLRAEVCGRGDDVDGLCRAPAQRQKGGPEPPRRRGRRALRPRHAGVPNPRPLRTKRQPSRRPIPRTFQAAQGEVARGRLAYRARGSKGWSMLPVYSPERVEGA